MGGKHAKLILVTGGSRSGKSRFAVTLARRLGRRIAYLATGTPVDREMRDRIARHRRERPAHWITLEPPTDPAIQLSRLNGKVDGAIIDCLTLYASTLLLRGEPDAAIARRIRRLCEAAARARYPVILVTNEVGCGVVPEQPLGRRFRDLAGLANQTAARIADAVVLMVAGIPTVIKGDRAQVLATWRA